MAKTTIGRLNVVLTAKTARFNQGMKSAGKGLNKFSSSAGVARSAMGKLAAATAGFLGVGALTSAIKTQLKHIDLLAKTASKLGTTTAALEGLQVAGQFTGVAVKTMNMGLQRMVRRVAEAGVGLGEARGALKELGLDAKRLSAMPLEQQFGAIGDALNSVESQADRVRLTFKLFDSEGVDLIRTLSMGSATLGQMSSKVVELGLGISDVDASRVEALNDSFTHTGMVLKGLVRSVLISLLPSLMAISAGIRSLVSETGMVDELTRSFTVLAKVIEGIMNVLHAFAVGMRAIEIGFRKAQLGVINFIKNSPAAQNPVAQIALGEAAAKAESQITGLNESIGLDAAQAGTIPHAIRQNEQAATRSATAGPTDTELKSQTELLRQIAQSLANGGAPGVAHVLNSSNGVQR